MPTHLAPTRLQMMTILSTSLRVGKVTEPRKGCACAKRACVAIGWIGKESDKIGAHCPRIMATATSGESTASPSAPRQSARSTCAPLCEPPVRPSASNGTLFLGLRNGQFPSVFGNRLP